MVCFALSILERIIQKETKIMVQSHYFHFTKAQLTKQSLNDAGIQTQCVTFSGRTDKWSLVDSVTATNGNNVYTFLGIFGLFENDYLGNQLDQHHQLPNPL